MSASPPHKPPNARMEPIAAARVRAERSGKFRIPFDNSRGDPVICGVMVRCAARGGSRMAIVDRIDVAARGYTG